MRTIAPWPCEANEEVASEAEFSLTKPRLHSMQKGLKEKMATFSSRLGSWLIAGIEEGAAVASSLVQAGGVAYRFLEEMVPEEDESFDEVLDEFSSCIRGLSQLHGQTSLKYTSGVDVLMKSPTRLEQQSKKKVVVKSLLVQSVSGALLKSSCWFGLHKTWTSNKPKLAEHLPLLDDSIANLEATTTILESLQVALQLVDCMTKLRGDLVEVFLARKSEVAKVVKASAVKAVAVVREPMGHPAAELPAICSGAKALLKATGECLPDLLQWCFEESKAIDEQMSTLAAGSIKATFGNTLLALAPQLPDDQLDPTKLGDFVAALDSVLAHHEQGSTKLLEYDAAVQAALPKFNSYLAGLDEGVDLQVAAALLTKMLNFCEDSEHKKIATDLLDVRTCHSTLQATVAKFEKLGDTSEEQSAADIDDDMGKAILQKVAALKASPVDEVANLFDASQLIKKIEIIMDGISQVHATRHEEAIAKLRDYLNLHGHGGEDGAAWYEGHGLHDMSLEVMLDLATKTLLELDGSTLNDKVKDFGLAIEARKQASELFGFDVGPMSDSDTNLLRSALATKVTACSIVVLKDCWGTGPQRVKEKRLLRKYFDELNSHRATDRVPKQLLDRLSDLAARKG